MNKIVKKSKQTELKKNKTKNSGKLLFIILRKIKKIVKIKISLIRPNHS